MYRRPKFLEVLLDIRREMAVEADYDVELFTEMARSGNRHATIKPRTGRRTESGESVKPDTAAELTRSRDK